MPSPRFYCSEPLAAQQTLTLPESIAHHVRVLRLAAGCQIVLFDGHGGEYSAVLDFNGKIAIATLANHQPIEAELAGQITLLQGLPSGDKMDWVIEKAVELGVSRIIPIAAQRSVLQLTGPRLEKRMLHWNKIIESASEQCGRNRLLQIETPISLEKALIEHQTTNRLLCDPEATEPFNSWLASPHANLTVTPAITLMVGPEGGWSQQELDCARRHSVQSVKFGARVLRTETAALAMVAAATAVLGW
jgi:16S rRNA (uracil1498-N3)-methyltransferase